MRDALIHGVRNRPPRLALPLLLLALSTLFLYGVDKGRFYRPGAHDGISSINLAVAENLSPDHGFRLFRELRARPDGAPKYRMYSRFPVGGYALLKLAILPFGNDLSAKILAARMLMLLLFSAAAVLAFHSLARITSRPWVALAATLMAFSSYYMLFYGDAVSNEYGMGLFAVMLAFHGMVVFVQEGRFPQLLAKTGVALLLGWRVYAFLLPFILLGLAREALRAWKHGAAPRPRLRSVAAAVLRSRYTTLGLASLLFGAALLTFNFANEYASFGGETPVTELPSVQSMLRRTGLDQDFAPAGWWPGFLRQQFFRVCVASVPFLLTDRAVDLAGSFPSLVPSAPGFSGLMLPAYLLALLMAAGAAAVLVRLAGPLLEGRQRLLLAALALSGFFWALPMRHNSAHHNHDALYYVGVPLALYSLLLLYLHQRWGNRPVAGLAAAALLAFAASAFQMDQRWGPDPRAAELQQAAMAELGAIRETTRGKVVLVLESVKPDWSTQAARPRHAWKYYLAGSVLTHSPEVEAAARGADFVVTRDRVESGALLTPDNRRVFLYDAAGIDDLVESYRAAYQRVVSSGDPAAHSRFDVYLGDRALAYVKEPCVREDVGDWIFMEAVPQDLRRLRRRYGSGDLDFRFRKRLALFDGKCIAVLSLPDYPISAIRTGLYFSEPFSYGIQSRIEGWTAEIPVGGHGRGSVRAWPRDSRPGSG